ncbi:hypothetical protein AB6A40_006779 [Gnathostoma spinigerum]|uniref:Uncharacterized protein n=1 Tax=Gnathostoma spinigerum TaxID=75299 RepID=A0ABD6EUZ3_9BILA
MWQEEIYTADDKTIRLLNNYLFDYRQHYTAVSWGAGIGLGTFLIVVSVSTIIAFVSIYARNRRKKEATRDVPEATANRSLVLSSSSSDSETRQSFNNRSRSNQEGDCVN